VRVLDRRLAREELARELEEVEFLLPVRERTRLGDEELAAAPALRLISQTGDGIAHLDLAAATRRGIAVSVTGPDSGWSTVELTIGLMLAAMRRIALVDRRMRSEAWPAIAGTSLEGKTVGVIGLGRIGSQVARLCRALRMEVLAAGKTLTEERAREVGARKVALEELLRASDVITIHARSSAETRGLIGEREFSLMKPGAFLINTARGAIVAEKAMIRALEEGRLAGVGLDVYDEEPLPLDHPLRRFDQAVLLSHRGYATVEVLRGRFQRALENILAFLDGQPKNLLNPEVLERRPGGER
jgi:phosphoglycerate dehydrogenase-like enzyme